MDPPLPWQPLGADTALSFAPGTALVMSIAWDDSLVTVVTPARNAEAFLHETLQSVAAQTHGQLEHLVVDDGSSDRTAEVVTDFSRSDSRVRLLSNRFEPGPAGARNTAIEAGAGRWLAFIDADDLWHPDKLTRQIARLRHSDSPLVWCAWHLIDAQGEHTGYVRTVPERIDHAGLLRFNAIGCLTALIDRSRVDDVLMPPIRQRQDWALWLKVLRTTGQDAISIPEPLASLRLHPGSLSANKLRSTWYNLRMQMTCEGIPLPRALGNVLAHAWRSRYALQPLGDVQ